MALDPTLDAALQGAAPTICNLFQINLPETTLRLVDGSAEIVFGGETFRGADPLFGTLDGIEAVTEQIGTEAPRVRFTFLPASLSALAEVASPDAQGSLVQMWVGAVDQATGQIIGSPELIFYGELDTAEVDYTGEATLITFDVASAWERLFELNEGARLNNAFHQSLWPGEPGFEFIPQITRREPWGFDAARPAVMRDYVSGQPGNALLLRARAV